MTDLVQANLLLLAQVSELISRLDERVYTLSSPIFAGSAIGGHVRHCLEHYQSFIEGLQQGRINYDHRARNVAIESRARAAMEALGEWAGALSRMDGISEDREVTVIMDHGSLSPDETGRRSSAARELQFLLSHTVHHMALISGLCRVHGVEVGDDFGVAHSTLRHRANGGSIGNETSPQSDSGDQASQGGLGIGGGKQEGLACS